MTYEMKVAGLKRDLPLCPISDTLMIGAFVIFGDVELTCACARDLLKLAPEFDYMVAPEAKAIPLVHEMARQSGRNEYFLVRKKKKAYMNGVFEAVDRSITTEGEQKLYMDGADAAKIRGKRILILDDVSPTGGAPAAEPDGKWGRDSTALFPFQVIAEPPPDFKADKLVRRSGRGHHDRLPVNEFCPFIVRPGKHICERVPFLLHW